MNALPAISPERVFSTLMAKGGRAERRKALQIIHGVCAKAVLTGAHDFGLATMGRLLESQGVLKARVLYNAQSRDYRALIAAWALHAGVTAGSYLAHDISAESLKTITNADTLARVIRIVEDNETLRRMLEQHREVLRVLST